MGNGSTELVSGGRPCPICGKPDWCRHVFFPNGDRLQYCKRVSGTKGETVQAMLGGIYRCSRVTEGEFTVWEPVEQYEKNREAWLDQTGKRAVRKKRPNLLPKWQLPYSEMLYFVKSWE